LEKDVAIINKGRRKSRSELNLNHFPEVTDVERKEFNNKTAIMAQKTW
jgi:hypothetical protein